LRSPASLARFLSLKFELHWPAVDESTKKGPLHWSGHSEMNRCQKTLQSSPMIIKSWLGYRSGSGLSLPPFEFPGWVHTSCFCLDAVLPLARLRYYGNGPFETQREVVVHGCQTRPNRRNRAPRQKVYQHTNLSPEAKPKTQPLAVQSIIYFRETENTHNRVGSVS